MLILQQMMVLFVIMLIGFFAERKGILDEKASKKISWIVVNIANPAMILSSVSGESRIHPKELAVTAVISTSMFLCLMGLAVVLPRILKVAGSQKGVYRVMTVFSNIGFMGFPIISALYGKEALLYAALFILPYNILIYTYGILCLSSGTAEKSREKAQKQKFCAGEISDREKFHQAETDGKQQRKEQGSHLLSSLKKIGNIGVLASLTALVLYCGNVNLPGVFTQIFDMLADLTAPLSMMVIGASFGEMSIKEMAMDVRLLVFAGIKLLVIPVAGMWILGQFVENTMLLGVCLVMLATPVGSMTAMLAQQYDCDSELAARGVALTTVLSVATIPAVAAVCGWFL